MSAAQWATIQAKKLLVYLEFPSHLPGGSTLLPVAQTLFERVVVPIAMGRTVIFGRSSLYFVDIIMNKN